MTRAVVGRPWWERVLILVHAWHGHAAGRPCPIVGQTPAVARFVVVGYVAVGEAERSRLVPWNDQVRHWCRLPGTALAAWAGPVWPSAAGDRAGWHANAPGWLVHVLACYAGAVAQLRRRTQEGKPDTRRTARSIQGGAACRVLGRFGSCSARRSNKEPGPLWGVRSRDGAQKGDGEVNIGVTRIRSLLDAQ